MLPPRAALSGQAHLGLEHLAKDFNEGFRGLGAG